MFSIFKKKTDEEFLKEILGEDLKKSDPAAAALGPMQGSSQFPGVAAMGAHVSMTSPPYTASQIAQALSSLSVGLTKEEEKQLEELRKEHALLAKKAKLGVFKTMVSSIRQQVINAYEWKLCFDNMNSTTVIKDPKLVELEKKEEMGKMFSTQAVYKKQSREDTWFSGLLFGPGASLPEGISLEDLKQAHMEASLEEEMLGNGQS